MRKKTYYNLYTDKKKKRVKSPIKAHYTTPPRMFRKGGDTRPQKRDVREVMDILSIPGYEASQEEFNKYFRPVPGNPELIEVVPPSNYYEDSPLPGKKKLRRVKNGGRIKKYGEGAGAGLGTKVVRDHLVPQGLPLNARQLIASNITGDDRFGIDDLSDNQRRVLFNTLENARKRTGKNYGSTEYRDYGPGMHEDIQRLKGQPLNVLAGSALSDEFNVATTSGRVSYNYNPADSTYQVSDAYNFSKTPDLNSAYATGRNLVGEVAQHTGLGENDKKKSYNVGTLKAADYRGKKAPWYDVPYEDVRKTLAPINRVIGDKVERATTQAMQAGKQGYRTAKGYYNQAKNTARPYINQAKGYYNKARNFYNAIPSMYKFEHGGPHSIMEAPPVNRQTTGAPLPDALRGGYKAQPIDWNQPIANPATGEAEYYPLEAYFLPGAALGKVAKGPVTRGIQRLGEEAVDMYTGSMRSLRNAKGRMKSKTTHADAERMVNEEWPTHVTTAERKMQNAASEFDEIDEVIDAYDTPAKRSAETRGVFDEVIADERLNALTSINASAVVNNRVGDHTDDIILESWRRGMLDKEMAPGFIRDRLKGRKAPKHFSDLSDSQFAFISEDWQQTGMDGIPMYSKRADKYKEIAGRSKYQGKRAERFKNATTSGGFGNDPGQLGGGQQMFDPWDTRPRIGRDENTRLYWEWMEKTNPNKNFDDIKNFPAERLWEKMGRVPSLNRQGGFIKGRAHPRRLRKRY